MGKNLNELENQMHSRETELMIKAMNQAQLRDKFKELKNKDESQIVKEA